MHMYVSEMLGFRMCILGIVNFISVQKQNGFENKWKNEFPLFLEKTVLLQ